MTHEPLSSVGPWLAIVGIGEDGHAGLHPAARAALDRAEVVYGGTRHLDLAAPLTGEGRPWPRPITDAYPEILARRGRPTCLLATGDPFHYGIGAEIARLVAPSEIAAYPQPSAFSLACARLGWPLAECTCLTLHGRSLPRIVPALQPGARLLVLAWDGTTAASVAALLAERGFGDSPITVLEAMGGPRERIRTAPAARFAIADIDPLNTVAIAVVGSARAQVVTLSPGLDDAWFENDGQLTKSEIRAVTLSALRPAAGQVLWDVGAGAGSVAIEWCLRHPANHAFAVEARAERAARIRRNADRLGVPDIAIVAGSAPAALAGLPEPDAIFIGGGVSDPAILAACLKALRPGGRLVANAVTLEGEAALLAAFAQEGGSLRRLSVARADPVGGMHGWRSAMPVTQWAWTKR
ncbi:MULTISPECIES: bifunctional cobalt-precorrin-7 (C(5))-methyltransferase/cobalt-precorrin-6B (C(15))-methyltransferase [unclassified Methylobacterium]|uniref:bifunctional cobalt-precorrin-7 (C(5))-methyltransferase/cobalt-precorrin-6B (C(15))-methyltransferase n=1 Tax=unclassified Methylobacterium TaxID=2615210 RepID=UPI0006FAE931|nr:MULTISPECIES: bifunctional cobalt-precorrin-7 (C(5))-methyltransferase/cobalt-precorrin-6B (C(15))-methyltransferase [unclassified Methylobacterium]KQP61204.1 precorrin-6Y methyltransferase [Methylobacterium sp. Leaf108]KQT78245.1 precorrin-6Y methyltransferase [Methylobacterium sp. Leaf466]